MPGAIWKMEARIGGHSHVGDFLRQHYGAVPDGWPGDREWVPDVAFSLVQSRLLNGKSIGFLPVKVHTPTDDEITRHGWQGVTLVIDEWILLEYACVFLPAQQNAVVEAVSKAAPGLSEDLRSALGIEGGRQKAVSSGQTDAGGSLPDIIPFISLTDIEKELYRIL